MAETASILREMRALLRRVNALVDQAEGPLTDDDVTEKDCQIALANLDQAKQERERLDVLTSELCAFEPTPAEEKELERVDAIAIRMARLLGLAKNAQTKFEAKARNDQQSGRHSWAHSTSVNSSAANASTLMRNKLPKIQLPTFGGDEQKFLNYKSQFVRLVHDNSEIEPEDKMVYLKSSLTGKAERLIRDIPTSAANYQKAWDAIVERYEDRFLIVESHFAELFAIQSIKTTRDIRDLIDQVDAVLRSLELSGETPSGWPGIVAYFVFSKLDERTQTDWKKTIQNRAKYATWDELRAFLRANASAVRIPATGHQPTSAPAKKDQKEKQASDNREPRKSFLVAQKPPCICCSQQHLIIECATFQGKTVRERMALIRQHKLCANCFNTGHSAYQCKSHKTCKVCTKKHHTLLHLDAPRSEETKDAGGGAAAAAEEAEKTGPANKEPAQAAANKPTCMKVTTKELTVLLPSARVPFNAGAAQGGALRALLDTCSQVTLVSDAFVRRYRLRTDQSTNQFAIAVSGVRAIATKQCRITLHSQFSEFAIDVVAEVVPNNALQYTVRNLEWGEQAKQLQGYQLADSAFHQARVNIAGADLLLGAAYLPQVLLPATKALGQLMLKETKFGWTILGPSAASHDLPVAVTHSPMVACCLTIQDIDDNLKKLFTTEEASAQAESSKLTKMHIQCDEHFERTYKRLPSGEFQVRNPYCAPITELTDNYRRALACLVRSEATNNAEKAELYKAFMEDYRAKGHMSLVENPIGKRHFLPHHAVLRPTSTTTKLRVVFNGSARTSSGRALNDVLMVGPKVQPDLLDVLLQFRTHKVAFTADIAQMYRCIKMHPDDRPMQSILWRENPTDRPRVYELNTVTYGLAPASFLATKCLQKLARSTGDEAVQRAIQTQFYMDDLLTGAESTQAALNLRKGVHKLLATAKFNLRKYQSNCAEFLANVPPQLVETSLARIWGEHDGLALLGVHWTPQEDAFRVRVPECTFETRNVTKRRLLSEVARIFDPLGLVAPATIREKMFIQSLWQRGLAWEQEVPTDLVTEFCALREERKLLKEFSVPRLLFEPSTQVELAGFCDASLKAYCAVVYARASCGGTVRSVRLVCAKTHVAPIKAITIPKLELCAAVLLAELLERVRGALGVSIEDTYAFSDSMVALAWIAKPPATWKTFVANRVEKVTKAQPAHRWGHVPTDQNPADLATRSQPVANFLKSDLWAAGPKFLLEPLEIQTFQSPEMNCELEKRKSKLTCNLTVTNRESEFFNTFICKFSCFKRMTRVFAVILLYVRKLKFRMFRKLPPPRMRPEAPMVNLTAENTAEAVDRLIALAQCEAYPAEIERLTNGKPVKKRSCLRSLNPYIENGVIRLATRLTNAEVTAGRKRPVVLSAGSAFVKLMIRYVHLRFFHATKTFIFSHLSTRYHLTGALRAAIKAECNRCVVCARYKAESHAQIMGDLPSARCTVSRPFTATGVDLAGPFTCRPMTARSKVRFKVYAAVFICFATRAVHLEVVASLSTEDFLSAFQRFTARRGVPKVVFSDNGTNFRGAAKFVDLRDEKIQSHCANEGISWRFNPPRAPHRGGVWEAAVKSMKYHLARVTKDHTLTLEQYATLLARIEVILNSRPLCYRAGDPESVILTSGHFLVGDRLTTVPEAEKDPLPLSKRYNCMRNLVKSFWLTWSRDYLSQLKSRSKWQKAAPNLAVGQVVLLRDDQAKPAHWDLARVEEVFPDQHGIVRTLNVRHGDSIKLRASSSVVPLPVDEPSGSPRGD